MYAMGTLVNGSWKTNVGVRLKRSGHKYTADEVELIADKSTGKAFFSFVSKLASSASDWATVNAADRFGAMTKDEVVAAGTPAWVKIFNGGGTAGSAFAWKTEAGKYRMEVDLDDMTLNISDLSAIGEIKRDPDADAPAVYYNLQGVRVENPGPGAYIRVRGSKAEKVFINGIN